MKRNYRKAYNALKKMGVTVYEGDYEGGEGFRISGEDNYPITWADYYKEFDVGLDDFGVNHKINDVLHDNGLFAEWCNTGVLGVAEK
tara:strand:+ start:598 stop:858 length:261 start_codon:yes stop_codon:yes gene_type:complete